MSTEMWSVACPGPSLDLGRVASGSPLICVNAALEGAERCDFWACYDAPNEIHEVAWADAQRLGPILLTGAEDAVAAWRQLMRLSKMWPWNGWPTIMSVSRPFQPAWFNQAANGPNYTVIAAINFALNRGAKRIEVHGADMAGVGYKSERASRARRAAQRAPHRWERRWEKERAMFQQVVNACHGAGVEVVRR